MITVVQNISAVITMIIGVVGLATLISKPFRHWITGRGLQNDASKAILRNEILRIYYKYVDEKRIPTYEKENLIGLYGPYHGLHGNTFVDAIYPEMMEWETYKKERG
jgi:hypothetical protein